MMHRDKYGYLRNWGENRRREFDDSTVGADRSPEISSASVPPIAE
jgi:hypothetical protein